MTRKTREELEREALAKTSPSKTTGGSHEAGADEADDAEASPEFEAVSEAERAEVNELFTLLHRNGYETAGGYSVGTEGPGEPKLVSLSVILPSTNDWDPSTAYDDGDGEATPDRNPEADRDG